MDQDLLFSRVAAHVFGVPLLLREREAAAIGSYLRSRMLGAGPDVSRFVGEPQRDLLTGRPKGYRRHGNVGIVSITGELVTRGAWLGASSGLTSYEGIVEQVRGAAEDPAVDTIVLDIDSPGGEALGMTDTARTIRALAGEKRMVAVVNALAASAGYGLATAASEIVINESGVAGSIGVVILHLDRSAQMDELGVKATLIHAGAMKTVGNPFEPLSERDRSVLQAEVDTVMNGFVGLVTDHRPSLTAEAVRAQEAGIFFGADAVAAGLADRVGTFEDVIAGLSSAARRANPQHRRIAMSDDKTAPAAEAGIPKNEHEAAIANAEASGRTAGAEAERTRMATILGSEGIRGDGARMAAALDLAVKSPAMSAEDVAAFVCANVAAAATPAGDGPSAYEQQRVIAAGLAAPEAPRQEKLGLSRHIDAHVARVTGA